MPRELGRLTRVLHVVGHFEVGGAERVATNLLRTTDPEQFDARAISLRGPYGTDLEEILAQDGIPVWYMGKERGFDPLVLARVTRTMEHFRAQVQAEQATTCTICDGISAILCPSPGEGG